MRLEHKNIKYVLIPWKNPLLIISTKNKGANINSTVNFVRRANENIIPEIAVSPRLFLFIDNKNKDILKIRKKARGISVIGYLEVSKKVGVSKNKNDICFAIFILVNDFI